jgi:hypothetical protein
LQIKADMWALNAIVAVALIAIFIFGFFMIASRVLPKDVADVKAVLADVKYSSQVLGVFGIPVGGFVVADFVSGAVGCSDIGNALRFVYGSGAGYVVKVDGSVSCSAQGPGASFQKNEFILPSYGGGVHSVSVEVFR